MLREFSDHALKGMVGKEFDFYGAANCQFKLNDVVMEAIEDPSDGYRSYLDCVLVRSEADQTIFFQTPIARVRVEYFIGSAQSEYGYNNEVDFHRLVDVVDGHVWLEFGTDNLGDYYPSFTFRYQPKAKEAK